MYFKIDNINLQPNLPVASDLRQILLLSQTRPITARVHFRAFPQLIICSSVSPDCPLKDLCPVDRLVSTRSKLIGALQKVNQFMVICLVNIPNHESFKCHKIYDSDSNCIFLVISTVINSYSTKTRSWNCRWRSGRHTLFLLLKEIRLASFHFCPIKISTD